MQEPLLGRNSLSTTKLPSKLHFLDIRQELPTQNVTGLCSANGEGNNPTRIRPNPPWASWNTPWKPNHVLWKSNPANEKTERKEKT
jgi:hypothetical protein